MLLLLVGCDDFVLFNDPPEVRFLAPATGAVVSRSVSSVFVAEVLDDVDPLHALGLQWTLEDDSVVSGTSLLNDDEDTVTLTTEGLPGGKHELTLRATDSSGEPGRATIAIDVYDNVAPYVSFSAPLPGQDFLAGTAVMVQGTVIDPDAVNAEDPIQLTWDGAASTIASAPAEVQTSAMIDFVIPGLAVADWTITVFATDLLGAVGESAVSFSVRTGDEDMDGYRDVSFGGDDCDDTDAGVNPAALEVCDGVDQDCDDTIDDNPEDGQTWYADSDQDRFGDRDGGVRSCDAPAGYVSTGTDCNDDDASVFPGSVEVCGNNSDDDCDGTIDSDAAEYVQLYMDNDEDGYGDGGWFEACSIVTGQSLVAGDCNDDDPSVNPEANEVCDSLDTDEDCTGVADDADPGATGQAVFYADNDRDGYGDSATSLAQCDPSANWVANTDDCDDTSDLAYTGATETCEDGVDNDCSGGDARCLLVGEISLAGADAKLLGPGALAFSGNAVAAAADADGDGGNELIVGSWAYAGVGAVHVVPGASIADGSLASFPTIAGEATGQYFGWAVASCGDADLDGASDYLASDIDSDDGAGAIYQFDTLGSYSDAGSANASIVGPGTDAALGATLACGLDLDDDGGIDALAGVPGTTGVWLLNAANLSVTVAWTGVTTGSEFAVAQLPDGNGDGIADLAIGENVGNTVYVWYGGPLADGSLLDADNVVEGENVDDAAGRAVASAGDVDDDGLSDLLVGAPESDSPATASGAAYLLLSGGAGKSNLGAADAIYRGESTTDRAGYTVSGAGDADGDGYDDVLVGAYFDGHGGTGAGAAYLFYGGAVPASGSAAAADAAFYGESGNDGASEGLGAGDFDGDGYGDVVVGAPVESTAGGAAGATYVLFGGGG